MTKKQHPSKKHNGRLIWIYSLVWKESDGLGRLLFGIYEHCDKQGSFLFKKGWKDQADFLTRSDWVVIDGKVAAWIEDYRDALKKGKQMPSDYNAGYCDALLAVIRHSLMN